LIKISEEKKQNYNRKMLWIFDKKVIYSGFGAHKE